MHHLEVGIQSVVDAPHVRKYLSTRDRALRIRAALQDRLYAEMGNAASVHKRKQMLSQHTSVCQNLAKTIRKNMKIGKYEFGYWFLLIALAIPVTILLKKFPDLPEWAYIALGTLILMGSERIYSRWFLHRICENQLNAFITRHNFDYQVKGTILVIADIHGRYDNCLVRIQIIHAMKNQVTQIECLIDNIDESKFTLSKRGFFGRLIKNGKTGIDPQFDALFRLKPAECDIFLDQSVRNQLSQIQNTFDIIDFIKLKNKKLVLFSKGLLTDQIKLEGALEAISVISQAIQ